MIARSSHRVPISWQCSSSIKGLRPSSAGIPAQARPNPQPNRKENTMTRDDQAKRTATRLAATAVAKLGVEKTHHVSMETEVVTGRKFAQRWRLDVPPAALGVLAKQLIAIHTVLDEETRQVLDMHVELISAGDARRPGPQAPIFRTRMRTFVPRSAWC